MDLVNLLLKLLVSYYSAPSIQAARPCRPPVKQDDDDLAPAPHYDLAQPRSSGSSRGSRGYSPSHHHQQELCEHECARSRDRQWRWQVAGVATKFELPSPPGPGDSPGHL